MRRDGRRRAPGAWNGACRAETEFFRVIMRLWRAAVGSDPPSICGQGQGIGWSKKRYDVDSAVVHPLAQSFSWRIGQLRIILVFS